MKLKRSIIIGLLILILFVVTISIISGDNNMPPEKALNKFSKLIEKGNIDAISLTIYYVDPFILSSVPWRVDVLINGGGNHKIVINGSDLKEHIGLLNQLSNVVLIPVEHESHIDARMYYVFETKKNRKIFDVSMWGSNGSIFVNGLQVKENYIFYDVVIPFMPEDAVKKEFERYIGRGKQEETTSYSE